MGRFFFIIALLLFSGGVWGNHSLPDGFVLDKEAFLDERGRLAPTPDPFEPNVCTNFIGDIGHKVRQMVEAQDPFLFSQAGRLTGGTEDLHIGERLWFPSGSRYTRFVFLLKGSLADNTTREFEDRFRYTADATFSTKACSGVSDDCPPNQTCEVIDEFNITLSIGKMRAEYQLLDRSFGPNAPLDISRRHAPFLYYPVDEEGGDVAPQALTACAGVEGSAVRCTQGQTEQSCRRGNNPCEPTTIFDPVDQAVVDAHCGPDADPAGPFDALLNQQCVLHCCATNASSILSVHRRWGAGPFSYLFGIGAPTLMTDVNITVVRARDGATRTVALQNANRGDAKKDALGGLRVMVNDIIGDMTRVLPDLSAGSIVVWDAGDGAGYVSQTSDPNVSPYGPGDTGLTPTRANLNGDFGWAYLNRSATQFWAASGGYGSLQAWTTARAIVGFGNAALCTNTDYADYVGLPGWELRPNGGLVEWAEDPCRISHHLNQLTGLVTGAADLSTLNITGHRGTYYLPPDYNLFRPNWYLVDGMRLVFELFPSEVLAYPNLIIQDPSRSIPPDHLADIPILTRAIIELYADLDEDFIAPLERQAGGVYGAIKDCSVNLENDTSTMYIEIGNPGLASEGKYFILNACQSDDATQLVVSQQPANFSLNVQAQGLKPKQIGFLVSTLVNASLVNATITCLSQIVPFGEQSDVVDELMLTCTNYGGLLPGGDDADVVVKDGGGVGVFQIIIFSLGALVLGGITIFAIISIVRSCTKRDATIDIKETGGR